MPAVHHEEPGRADEPHGGDLDLILAYRFGSQPWSDAPWQANPTQDVREVAPRLHELMQEPENDRDYVVASLVEEPTWYAKNYGRHTGRWIGAER